MVKRQSLDMKTEMHSYFKPKISLHLGNGDHKIFGVPYNAVCMQARLSKLFLRALNLQIFVCGLEQLSRSRLKYIYDISKTYCIILHCKLCQEH